ncbi:hypothetical protein [Streptomyces ochraceiscleroticus]|uniref:Transposase n=1 Tax=Streptomyces ochraceiscleroticus TaxID=47761 RepID=A0ABW1MJL5_9ACTN|nr:hypothetical protein [Streptomyces ochraceiscleroticus]
MKTVRLLTIRARSAAYRLLARRDHRTMRPARERHALHRPATADDAA